MPEILATRITWRDVRIPAGHIGVTLSLPSEHAESGYVSAVLILASFDALTDEQVAAAALSLAGPHQDTDRLADYPAAIRAAVARLRTAEGAS